MLAFVLSWVTTSAVTPANSICPLVWSPWVCVLMIVVIGLLVMDLIFSSRGGPHPGFFVSTTATPFDVRNTAVFPPPPLRT